MHTMCWVYNVQTWSTLPNMLIGWFRVIWNFLKAIECLDNKIRNNKLDINLSHSIRWTQYMFAHWSLLSIRLAIHVWVCVCVCVLCIWLWLHFSAKHHWMKKFTLAICLYPTFHQKVCIYCNDMLGSRLLSTNIDNNHMCAISALQTRIVK